VSDFLSICATQLSKIRTGKIREMFLIARWHPFIEQGAAHQLYGTGIRRPVPGGAARRAGSVSSTQLRKIVSGCYHVFEQHLCDWPGSDPKFGEPARKLNSRAGTDEETGCIEESTL
jgi:hypothetical protein